MKYEFVKLSPTQNMTIIVKSPVPRAEQARVAGALMDYSSVYAEQAGFLEEPGLPGARLRLQMMGGEFCGNAAMCAAAFAAREDGVAPGEERVMPIEMSGADGLTNCLVRAKEGFYACTVNMPLPVSFGKIRGLDLVRLPGIDHAVMFTDEPEKMMDGAPELLRTIAGETDADAAGLMLYSRSESRMIPLVYVRSTDTMVWERGCGSGSAAVGALEARLTGGNSRAELAQPGGKIIAEADWNGNGVTALRISGEVRIAAEGTAYV
jgi:diaminopimelate epimerase